MKTAVITCTGHRPEALELCKTWLLGQTYKDFNWVTVTDNDPASAVLQDGPVLSFSAPRPFRYYANTPPIVGNTLSVNYRRALEWVYEHTDAEYFITAEDDDFYTPDYIEEVVEALHDSAVVGLSNVTYYNMRRQYYELKNLNYAPLAFTAFRQEMLPHMFEAIEDPSPYKTFDLKFWSLVRDLKQPYCMIDCSGKFPLAVGMKGLPGRPGIGKGHRDTTAWKGDKNLEKLNDLMPCDDHLLLYLKYLR